MDGIGGLLRALSTLRAKLRADHLAMPTHHSRVLEETSKSRAIAALCVARFVQVVTSRSLAFASHRGLAAEEASDPPKPQPE